MQSFIDTNKRLRSRYEILGEVHPFLKLLLVINVIFFGRSEIFWETWFLWLQNSIFFGVKYTMRSPIPHGYRAADNHDMCPIWLKSSISAINVEGSYIADD